MARRCSTSSSSSEDAEDEFHQLQLAREQYYKSRATLTKKPSLVETKIRQISLPKAIRTDNDTLDFIITCLSEWLTLDTRDYLKNHIITSSTTINPQRYQQLVRKLELQEMIDPDGNRAEKNLPTIDELKKTAEQGQYELKVKDFFTGKIDSSEKV